MAVDFSVIGKAIGNPARSAMVGLLVDGRAYTATELARVAGVSASTASGHLDELSKAGLVRVAAQGRHRYYKLADDEVGSALEALAGICPATEVRSLRQSADARRLAFARTCYDHLAGAVAVAVFEAMLAGGWLLAAGDGLDLTPAGEERFARLGVDLAGCRGAKRNFARPCIDWTERRPHLAGSLGAAMTGAMVDGDWWRRPPTGGRGLVLTDKGRSSLSIHFGMGVEERQDFRPAAS